MNKLEAINKCVERLKAANLTPNAVQLLKASTDTVLTRAKANLEALMQEEAANPVSVFMSGTADRLTDTSMEWLDQVSGNLVVFPEGTRFVNRDENTLTVVVEQKPTQRRINFRSYASNAQGRTDYVNNHYFISLPYIQFIATFHKARKNYTFGDLKIVCTKAPLATINDKVYALPLPNVHQGHQVCTGGDHGMELPEGRDSILIKMNTLIGEFWQTMFNTDLTTSTVLFMQRNFGYDSVAGDAYAKMRTCFQKWAELSAANPMFMLEENTNLGQHIAFGRLLQNDVASRTGKTAYKTRMKQDITNAITNISNAVTNTIRSYNLNEDNIDKAHIETLNRNYVCIAGTAFDMLYDEVSAYATERAIKRNNELENLSKELNARDLAATRRERELSSRESVFTNERNHWAAEKAKQEQELRNTYAYLQQLKAQIEAGQPVARPTPVAAPAPAPTPAPTPARPTRIPPAPGRRNNRGRPRKNPIQVGSISRIRGRVFVWTGSEWAPQNS